MLNNDGVLVPNASLLCLAHILLAHIHAAHIQTHLTFTPVLPTLQNLTYSDVEAVNAEGGTPTLPKSMLLRVSFHRFGTLRSPLAFFNLF